jgi:hypothetical protein
MKKYSFVVLIGLILVAGLLFTNSALLGKDGKGDTKLIGGAGAPAVQTGPWDNMMNIFGTAFKEHVNMKEVLANKTAEMKVVDPAKLLAKGFTNINAGDSVRVKLVNDKQAKIKLLPNGPEKTINIQ